MAKRFALFFLGIAPPVILLTFVFGTAIGEVVFALLGILFPIALMVLGAQRKGKLGPLFLPLLAFVLIMVLGVVGMLIFRGQVVDGPWLFGLPMAGAIQFYFVFLVPFLLVSLAYGLTFERFGLRQRDLDALRSRFRKDDSESR
jgi:prepilin signal peptidase PulO-like enzyme (type II secretory pathway)